MTTVELHQAFVWDCDNCGAENFCRSRVVTPESIDPDELPDNTEHDEAVRDWIESGGSGIFHTAPESVRCRECDTEFETEQPE